MKQIYFLIIGSIVVFFGCEKTNTIMYYEFFTEEELSNIYINQDSAMNLQVNLSKCITYDEFIVAKTEYKESDTIFFQTEIGDTLKFVAVNAIDVRKNDAFFRTETGTYAWSEIEPIDSVFIDFVSIGIMKTSAYDHIERSVFISSSRYKYKNSIWFDLSGNRVNDTNTYFVVSQEQFVLDNLVIDNCLFIRKFNLLSQEELSIVYSNKYGFIQLKDNQHEITRIL